MNRENSYENYLNPDERRKQQILMANHDWFVNSQRIIVESIPDTPEGIALRKIMQDSVLWDELVQNYNIVEGINDEPISIN